ncbi:hypothetical protein [Faecalibaculum rodentium]|uniref:hypothetical protein n=1 Tax=Faecalibaculum rodentium TaxID=1702221 RepID=UPI0027317386|nr:hypothetical protein [Faecalibaculum rodentium]
MSEIKLILDQGVLDRYNAYYFKKYPKRKKVPIPRPIHESINTWMILQRPAMNGLKQRWKEFVVWWMNELGLDDKKLSEFSMEFTSFMPTKRRSDPDNSVPKFILDGFTEAGFIEDDDGKHLKSLTLATSYDKDNPRTEIVVRVFD